jgi:Reverse transcriptase (RNA-dependent DNA polymerase)
MDVKNVFLQGDLDEEVYMDPPPGYPTQGNKVCLLKKAIYGLKQSPRAWYGKLSTALIQFGFKHSATDSSMFIKRSCNRLVVVLVYVDDLVITGNDKPGIEFLKQQLKQQFDIKDLGILRYFLGIEVARSYKGLFISQRKYVLDLLKETGMMGARPASTPMEYNDKCSTDDSQWKNIEQFQRLIGKLIYLTITRPDISYVVSYISQFMQKPTKGHMGLVNHLLRYLKATPGRGILMKKNGHTKLRGYVDADWAGNLLDRKSTSGFCIFIGGNPVTWKSKKQTVVARSSAEAKYRAMDVATSEIVWLCALLHELNCNPLSEPTELYCDNQAAVHIASNPVFHERTKHIEVNCHFVREKIIDNTITTPYICSKN